MGSFPSNILNNVPVYVCYDNTIYFDFVIGPILTSLDSQHIQMT